MPSHTDDSDSEEGRPVVVKSATDLQRLKLEKLMKNPAKPVVIPDRLKEKKLPHVPDFVRNVMGSSAGAGSGEFHVYRHLRRKEYSRQKVIQDKAEKLLSRVSYLPMDVAEIKSKMKKLLNFRSVLLSQFSMMDFSNPSRFKNNLDEEYHRKLEENKRLADERTAKKRAKRLKKKAKKKKLKEGKTSEKKNSSNGEESSNEEQESSEEDK